MQGNERKRILKLVEEGTLSAEEALVLLEKLKNAEQTQTPIQSVVGSNQSEESSEAKPTPEKSKVEQQESEEQSQTKEEEPFEKKTTGFEDLFGRGFGNKEGNGKFDDVMNELKKDLTDFGQKVSSIFNTTFSKVKGFEADVPFGEKVEFKDSFAFNAEEVKGFELDLPNSKVEVVKATDALISVDVLVKTTLQNSEEETKQHFFEDFATLKEHKLTLKTPSKFSQVHVTVAVPEKQYDVFIARSLNSDVKINGLHAKVLKVSLANGPIQLRNVEFEHADVTSKNGSVETRFVKGDDLEVETLNGRIYVEGDLREVEAESINGHVAITTTSSRAHKVKASTVAGVVELYLPRSVAIDGKLSTNFGKIDLALQDVTEHQEDATLFQKVTHFDKAVAGSPLLKVVAESKTGSILVRYNPENQ